MAIPIHVALSSSAAASTGPPPLKRRRLTENDYCQDCHERKPTFLDERDNQSYCRECWINFYGHPPSDNREIARISGNGQGRDIDSTGVNLDALPADAPRGHRAHKFVKYKGWHKDPLVSFHYEMSGQNVPFQTTLAAVGGSRRAAEVIARACWLKFEEGWTKHEILKFRNECYARVKRSGFTGSSNGQRATVKTDERRTLPALPEDVRRRNHAQVDVHLRAGGLETIRSEAGERSRNWTPKRAQVHTSAVVQEPPLSVAVSPCPEERRSPRDMPALPGSHHERCADCGQAKPTFLDSKDCMHYCRECWLAFYGCLPPSKTETLSPNTGERTEAPKRMEISRGSVQSAAPVTSLNEKSACFPPQRALDAEIHNDVAKHVEQGTETGEKEILSLVPAISDVDRRVSDLLSRLEKNEKDRIELVKSDNIVGAAAAQPTSAPPHGGLGCSNVVKPNSVVGAVAALPTATAHYAELGCSNGAEAASRIEGLAEKHVQGAKHPSASEACRTKSTDIIVAMPQQNQRRPIEDLLSQFQGSQHENYQPTDCSSTSATCRTKPRGIAAPLRLENPSSQLPSARNYDECGECGARTDVFLDSTDGMYYCRVCWRAFYGSHKMQPRPGSSRDGRRKIFHSSAVPEEASLAKAHKAALPEDAPLGHPAHKSVRFDRYHKNPLVFFEWRAHGQKVHFQTTVVAAGSREAAEVIARACWMKFEQGWSKADVLAFRNECYVRSRHHKVAGEYVAEQNMQQREQLRGADVSPPKGGRRDQLLCRDARQVSVRSGSSRSAAVQHTDAPVPAASAKAFALPVGLSHREERIVEALPAVLDVPARAPRRDVSIVSTTRSGLDRLMSNETDGLPKSDQAVGCSAGHKSDKGAKASTGIPARGPNPNTCQHVVTQMTKSSSVQSVRQAQVSKSLLQLVSGHTSRASALKGQRLQLSTGNTCNPHPEAQCNAVDQRSNSTAPEHYHIARKNENHAHDLETWMLTGRCQAAKSDVDDALEQVTPIRTEPCQPKPSNDIRPSEPLVHTGNEHLQLAPIENAFAPRPAAPKCDEQCPPRSSSTHAVGLGVSTRSVRSETRGDDCFNDVGDFLPEDAPIGHPARAAVKFRSGHRDPLFNFVWREGGQHVPFQTTVAAAGSRHAAEVIARACWMKFEQGWTKPEVTEFRNTCYARTRHALTTGDLHIRSDRATSVMRPKLSASAGHGQAAIAMPSAPCVDRTTRTPVSITPVSTEVGVPAPVDGLPAQLRTKYLLRALEAETQSLPLAFGTQEEYPVAPEPPPNPPRAHVADEKSASKDVLGEKIDKFTRQIETCEGKLQRAEATYSVLEKELAVAELAERICVLEGSRVSITERVWKSLAEIKERSDAIGKDVCAVQGAREDSPERAGLDEDGPGVIPDRVWQGVERIREHCDVVTRLETRLHEAKREKRDVEAELRHAKAGKLEAEEALAVVKSTYKKLVDYIEDDVRLDASLANRVKQSKEYCVGLREEHEKLVVERAELASCAVGWRGHT